MSDSWKHAGVQISRANKKLKRIPSVNLLPVAACPAGVPCAKDCYAVQSVLMYKLTRIAWTNNLKIARNAPSAYFNAIRRFLWEKQPEFFRWHSAGDILDADYLDEMRTIAAEEPATKFLAFTKRYDLEYRLLPSNLSIVLSAWPGWELHNPCDLPVAWMDDGTDERIPDYALECVGTCDTCALCWHLSRIGLDVVFKKH